MAKITVLDENMINMIAAGEVIERPASVVKELLENSLDAGAESITVKIEDGGKKLISVSDNGAGIESDEIQNALKPHATSKIRNADDLLAISTMGFRGEALASIASVSKLKLVSRTAENIEATEMKVDSGSFGQPRPAGAPVGTTIEVRDLFYKLPGRRKFLRTANTEMSHITETFNRAALARTDIELKLIHNGKQIHHLLPNQPLLERIRELMGNAVADGLLETHSREKGIDIKALMGKPSSARTNSKYQFVFLNGRFIRDKLISHAIREAYRSLIESGKYPLMFLFISMDPAAYDVNVHPTKSEVRFENSNLVHSQVLAVLREKLLSTDLDTMGSVNATDNNFKPGNFDKKPPPQNNTKYPKSQTEQKSQQNNTLKALAEFFNQPQPPAQERFKFNGRDSRTAKTKTPNQPYQNQQTLPNSPENQTYQDQQPYASPSGDDTGNRDAETLEPFTDHQIGTVQLPGGEFKFIQIHNSYIVLQNAEGFAIIDQHALHERIIYQKLLTRIETGSLTSQRLLIPETLELSQAQIRALNEHGELIEKLGLEIRPFGPDTYAVESFPALLGNAGPAEFANELLDMLADQPGDGGGNSGEAVLQDVLEMTACKAAIKAGQPLNNQEIAELLTEKENTQRSSNCPHGRPTTITFTLKELEKQFKRT